MEEKERASRAMQLCINFTFYKKIIRGVWRKLSLLFLNYESIKKNEKKNHF